MRLRRRHYRSPGDSCSADGMASTGGECRGKRDSTADDTASLDRQTPARILQGRWAIRRDTTQRISSQAFLWLSLDFAHQTHGDSAARASASSMNPQVSYRGPGLLSKRLRRATTRPVRDPDGSVPGTWMVDRMVYRVWSEARGSHARPRRTYFCVSTPQEGEQVIEFLKRTRRYEVFRSSFDVFGLEFLSDDGWREWHDPGGFDVMGRAAGDAAVSRKPSRGFEHLTSRREMPTVRPGEDGDPSTGGKSDPAASPCSGRPHKRRCGVRLPPADKRSVRSSGERGPCIPVSGWPHR